MVPKVVCLALRYRFWFCLEYQDMGRKVDPTQPIAAVRLPI